MQSFSKRHRLLSQTSLLEGWSPVVRVQYEQSFRDGTFAVQDRDLNARADGVTVLLHSPDRRRVLLLRQPRIVAALRGERSGETLEACSGMLDAGETPASCAAREVLEETGIAGVQLCPVTTVYASPGGSLELIHLFTAAYSTLPQAGAGGLRGEGEDIVLVELGLGEAMERFQTMGLQDARTLLLLQHLALALHVESRTTAAGLRNDAADPQDAKADARSATSDL